MYLCKIEEVRMNGSLTDFLRNEMQSFSKSHRMLAEYILSNYDKAAFMTAAKLGKVVNVSESTVIRFAICMDMTDIRNYRKHC